MSGDTLDGRSLWVGGVGTMLEACDVWSPGMLLNILNVEDSPSNRELLGLESLQC